MTAAVIPDGVLIRNVLASDRKVWGELYEQFRLFHEFAPDAAVLSTVWGWLMDDTHQQNCVVAIRNGELAGLAHYRTFPRAIEGGYGLYLDDLFVADEHRGHGIATSLMARLQTMRHAEGLMVVRWITGHDNTNARRLYDSMASSGAVSYNLDPKWNTEK